MPQRIDHSPIITALTGEPDTRIAQVRDLMPRDGHGYRSLTEVAREMGTSSRTLKRQLAARGTQFSAILEQLRHDRALRLLADATLPLTAVAHQLGYADLAGFTRAFRRWTGTSPGAHRKAMAAAATAIAA